MAINAKYTKKKKNQIKNETWGIVVTIKSCFSDQIVG